MDKLRRDIAMFLSINHHRQGQVGGYKAGRKEIIYNGHKIYYTSYQNIYGDKDTIFINGGRDSGRRPCFVLSIKGPVGILQSLERGSDCFVDRYDNSRDLAIVAFQIAKEQGCTEFELTDNSFKSCPPYKFQLSDVYFLTKGQTWYESILPIKIKSLLDSEISEFRKKARTTKWTVVSDYLLRNGANLDFVSTKGIEVDKDGSAMEILNRIKDMKNDISCRFFATYTGRILFISGVPTFHGTSWKF